MKNWFGRRKKSDGNSRNRAQTISAPQNFRQVHHISNLDDVVNIERLVQDPRCSDPYRTFRPAFPIRASRSQANLYDGNPGAIFRSARLETQRPVFCNTVHFDGDISSSRDGSDYAQIETDGHYEHPVQSLPRRTTQRPQLYEEWRDAPKNERRDSGHFSSANSSVSRSGSRTLLINSNYVNPQTLRASPRPILRNRNHSQSPLSEISPPIPSATIRSNIDYTELTSRSAQTENNPRIGHSPYVQQKAKPKEADPTCMRSNSITTDVSSASAVQRQNRPTTLELSPVTSFSFSVVASPAGQVSVQESKSAARALQESDEDESEDECVTIRL